MKKNPAFLRFLRSTIVAGLGKIDALDKLGHPFLRGRLREVFIQDVLRAMTPQIFGIVSGKLIDPDGNESAETDIIVFRKDHLPFIPIDQGLALIPIENCRYALEIKTNLRSDALESTILKARRFAGLIHNPDLYSHFPFGIIALKAPARSKQQWTEDLSRLFPETPIALIDRSEYNPSMYPKISIIVTPHWYLYFGLPEPSSGNIGWHMFGPYQGIDRSLREFLTGYVNTLASAPSINIIPNFGSYLSE